MSKMAILPMFLVTIGLARADRQVAALSRPAKHSPTSAPSGKSLPWGSRSYLESTQRGDIDWTNGEILARGVGKVVGSGAQAAAMGRRAARLAAAHNAVLLASGLRIDPAGRRFDIVAGKITVEGVLRDFEEAAVEYDPKLRTVTVTLRVPLYGIKGLVTKMGVVVSERQAKWSWSHGDGTERPPHVLRDSVVIDARGTGFTPVMFPVLQTDGGKRIFDASDVRLKQLIARPMVIYAGTDKKLAPVSQPAAGPLVIRPIRAKGKAKGILVLGETALSELAAHPECRELMRSGKLIVLAGPPPKGISTRSPRGAAIPGGSSQGRAAPTRGRPQEKPAGETAR